MGWGVETGCVVCSQLVYLAPSLTGPCQGVPHSHTFVTRNIYLDGGSYEEGHQVLEEEGGGHQGFEEGRQVLEGRKRSSGL